MRLPTLVLTSVWRKLRISFFIGLLSLFSFDALFAQEGMNNHEFTVLFYNVENLFDTIDDPQTEDDEFCEGGLRNWNYFRLKEKLNKISKVIMAANGFDPPALIGLCEIENRQVLEDLVGRTPLKQFNYKIIHKDSPDHRGIDVAMLYRDENVRPLHFRYYPLIDYRQDTLKSREILEASFLAGEDTLTVFINHWPSRYSGQAETEPDRLLAAKILRRAVEGVFERNAEAKIVILGDFNDEPDDRSMLQGLQVKNGDNHGTEGELVNLSCLWKPQGTLKHQQSWQVFDQVIVSDYLLRSSQLKCTPQDAGIVELPFLFELDERWGGRRLFRTYRGYKFAGGFSDHLPVMLRIRSAN